MKDADLNKKKQSIQKENAKTTVMRIKEKTLNSQGVSEPLASAVHIKLISDTPTYVLIPGLLSVHT